MRFGSTVELETGAGERARFTIVGEDESDPAQGRISYVSPIAEGLIGAQVGDEVPFRRDTASIVSIE